jgi:hypothetical protein
MRTRLKYVNLFLALLVVVAIAHFLLQMSYFDSVGISGRAVSEDGGESGRSLTSKAILLAEWGLILLGMIFVYTKHRIDSKKEFESLKKIKESKTFKSGTELDNVYELLQEVRHIRVSNCAKLFDVKPEIVEEWAKSLEANGLAELAYPRIGGSELRILPYEPKKQGFF